MVYTCCRCAHEHTALPGVHTALVAMLCYTPQVLHDIPLVGTQYSAYAYHVYSVHTWWYAPWPQGYGAVEGTHPLGMAPQALRRSAYSSNTPS